MDTHKSGSLRTVSTQTGYKNRQQSLPLTYDLLKRKNEAINWSLVLQKSLEAKKKALDAGNPISTEECLKIAKNEVDILKPQLRLNL